MIVLVIFTLIAAFLTQRLIRKLENQDYCPRLYEWWPCKGDRCDHSTRAWALVGIDREWLDHQPYKEMRGGPSHD